MAALNKAGDKLVLFCVNRSLDTDMPARIQIDGFTTEGEASIQTLRGSSITDANDEDNPEWVIPIQTEEALAKGVLLHIFPHERVAVITLRRR